MRFYAGIRVPKDWKEKGEEKRRLQPRPTLEQEIMARETEPEGQAKVRRSQIEDRIRLKPYRFLIYITIILRNNGTKNERKQHTKIPDINIAKNSPIV